MNSNPRIGHPVKWRPFHCGILLLACLSWSLRDVVAQQRQQQSHISIGEQFTRLTSPLTKDGYVDYSAAINAINSVSPNDNAAADFIAIQGVPKYWEKVQRQKLKTLLGLSALSNEGDNFKSIYDFSRDLKNAGSTVPNADRQVEQQDLASSRPWTRGEAPFVHSWININSKFLDDRLDAILTKPGYYEPKIAGRERDLTIAPNSCGIANAARWRIRELLVGRCLLHLGERRVQEAIEDILRIHKLARLGKRAKLASGLIENTHLERHALTLGEKALKSGVLDRASLQSYLDALQRLEPVLTAKDLCEHNRLFHLASVSICAVKSPKKFIGDVQAVQRIYENFFPNKSDESAKTPNVAPHCFHATSDQIDWNYLLRKINDRYDHTDMIHAMPDSIQRLRSLQKIVNETRSRKFHFMERSRFLAARKQNKQDAKRRLSDDLDLVLNEMLNTERYSTIEELAMIARLDLLKIMTAVRLHEKIHGELPMTNKAIQNTLGMDLVDPFSGEPYQWKYTKKSLTLSSASSNYKSLPNAYRKIEMTLKAMPE